jgi:hypothetical protein
MLLINQGQDEGKTIRPPMQINRSPQEKSDIQLKNYYQNLLQLKQSKLFREGQWSMAQLNQQAKNLITLEVISNDQEIKALIFINMGRDHGHIQILQQANYQAISTYQLNNNHYSYLKSENENLNFSLAPLNTQIVFFAS